MTAFTLLTSCLMLSQLARGLPSGKRPFQRQISQNQDWIHPNSRIAITFEESPASNTQNRFPNERAIISSEWPLEPPRFFSRQTIYDNRIDRVSNSSNRISKRSIRSSPHLHSSNPPDPSSSSIVPACESASRWVKLTEADDLWGNRVTVLQQFDNGHGARVDQYFFETYCNRPAGHTTARPPTCAGTDTANFDSYCLEKHVWGYGKIYDQQQRQERWTFIKIRAACSCGVTRKSSRRTRSVNQHGRRFQD